MSSTDKITVQLPDLVVSFLSEQPSTNENYDTVSPVSRKWLVDTVDLDQKGSNMLQKGDFTYFCAISTPKACVGKYRDFCDWVNWIFPFDDFFDNGVLKDDPKAARVVLEQLVCCMNGLAEPDTKFVEAHHDIWIRFQQKASQGTCNRLIKAITDYSTDVLHQVQQCSIDVVQKPEDLIKTRRNTIGVKPLYVFVEYGHDLNIPDEVFEHPLIQEIEILGVDWVLIQNDILSYCTEEEEGVNHNLISANRAQGMAAQEAFDDLGSRLESIYERFDAAVVSLPLWGEVVDKEVQLYVEGIKNCIKANLHWSFRTDRYFGSMKKEVLRTGQVDVLKEPPYLSG